MEYPVYRRCIICDRPFEAANSFDEICDTCAPDEIMLIDDLMLGDEGGTDAQAQEDSST